jgi:catechol 2,3-dioxygenase-like lactoylglutathione lyase family enzyme
MEAAMLNPDYVLLYVDDALASARFYETLLGAKPVEAAPTFALFVLPTIKLGLWTRETVEPKAIAATGSAELAFSLPGTDAFRETYDALRRRQLPIAQEPTEMDFGTSFVALDPDGHRLRFFVPVAR